MAFTNITVIENRIRIQSGFRILLLYKVSQTKIRSFFTKSEVPIQGWGLLEVHSGISRLLTCPSFKVRQLAKKINERGFGYFDAWWDLRFDLGPQHYTQFGAGGTDLWYSKDQPEKRNA